MKSPLAQLSQPLSFSHLFAAIDALVSFPNSLVDLVAPVLLQPPRVRERFVANRALERSVLLVRAVEMLRKVRLVKSPLLAHLAVVSDYVASVDH